MVLVKCNPHSTSNPTITSNSNGLIKKDSRIPLLFPNHSEGKAEVRNAGDYSIINVYNFTGELILQKQNNSRTINLDIEKSGVYFVELTSKTNRQILKLIVTR
jgi:hypothetical protein